MKLNLDEFLIVSLTRACRLKNDRVSTRLPIQKGLLSMILKQVKSDFHKAGQVYLATLYQALFSTAYFGLFRVGELTTGTHPVLARSVHIGSNKRKMLLLLQTSKTHGKGNKPQLIKILSKKAKSPASTKCKDISNARELPCPFMLLQQYVSQRIPRTTVNEPFFIFHDGSPVTPRHFNMCLKNTIKKLGFDETLYSGHSLRAGRTSDLLKLGLSVETIKKLGRWRSNTVYCYML